METLFSAGNQGNRQNFEKNDTSYESQGFFHCMHFEKNLGIHMIWLVKLIDAEGIGVAPPIWS